MSDTYHPNLDSGIVARLRRHTNFTRDLEAGQLEDDVSLRVLGRDGREVGDAVSSAVPRQAVLRRRARPVAEVVGDLANLRLGERTNIISGEDAAADPGATLDTEADFIRKANRLLAEALQHPNELTDYTAKLQALGVLSEVLKVVSTIAVNLATTKVYQNVDTESFEDRMIGKATYLGTSLLLNTATPDAVSWVTRKLGGVETKIYATLDPKRSNVGTYNEIAGKTLLTMGQTWIYGAVSTSIYAGVDYTGLARTATATIPAALAAATIGQGVNAYLNYRTLQDQGVTSHSDLRTQRHNHDPKVGRISALTYAIPAVTDRTTAGEKTIEVLLRTAASVLQQGTLLGLQALNPFDPRIEPAKYQAYTVFAGFTGGLCMQAMGNAAGAYFRTDPARHRQRYMTVANEIRCQQLRDSSLNLRTACLNEVANNLSGEVPADNFFASTEALEEHKKMRLLFESASRIMRADAPNNFKSNGNIDDVQRLKAFFESQKAAYEDNTSQVGEASKGSVTHAREILDFLVKDLSHLERTFRGKDDGGQAVGPSFTDLVQRTRELSMLLFQSDYLEGEAGPARGENIAMTAALTPVLAGLRHADRRAHAVDSLNTIQGIQKLSPDGGGKAGLAGRLYSTISALFQQTPLTKLVQDLTDSLDGLGSFGGPGAGFSKKHYEFLRIFGTDLTGAIDEALMHIAPEHKDNYLARVSKGVETARTVAQNDNIGSLAAQSALCTLEGQLRQRLNPNLIDERAHESAILRFGKPEDAGSVVSDADPLKALMNDAAAGIIDFSAFSRFLSNPASIGSEDLGIEQQDEIRGAGDLLDAVMDLANVRGRRERITEAGEAMQNQVGDNILRALQGDKGIMQGAAETARRMLDCQAQDIKNMHHMVRPLLTVGLLLGRVDSAHKLVIELQKDAHLHPDNFNKLRVVLDVLFDLQKASGILASAIMSIPFNIQNPRPEVVYYGNNYPNSWHHNPNEELLKKQVVGPNVLATTALNLQEPEKIAADITLALQNDPDDVIKAIGEITLKKLGGITDAATIDIIKVDKIASKLLVPAARAGYAMTIHHDFGEDHGDFKLGKNLMDAIKRANQMLQEEVDPLAAGANYGDTPRAKLRVCVPHLGMSPQNSGGPGLSGFWKKCLEDDELRETLTGDLSWSFTTKYITSDIRDQIRNISPMIAVGLDAWANAYSSFQMQGGTADKLTDLGDLSDEAAQHKNASDGIADFYARTVAFVDSIVKMEMNDPAKAQKVLDLIQNHGDAGNNWLYILGNHSDRLMFGTDNLASGVKIHGEAEHMLDALALHPVYSIFRALSREAEVGGGVAAPPRNLALANVVPNLARNVWDDFFLDVECSDRRQAMRVFVQEVKPTDTRRALGNVVSYVKRVNPNGNPSARTRELIARIRGIPHDEEDGNFPGADVLVPLLLSLQSALEKTRPDPEPEDANPTELMINETLIETASTLAQPAAGGEQADARPLTLHRAMVRDLLTRLEQAGKADELVKRLKQAGWLEGRVAEFERALAKLREGAEA